MHLIMHSCIFTVVAVNIHIPIYIYIYIYDDRRILLNLFVGLLTGINKPTPEYQVILTYIKY